MELTGLRNALIGTEEDYGLSFEQKKRLSIAVELAASPSILFLDEVSDFIRLSWSSGFFHDVSLTPLCVLLQIADQWSGCSKCNGRRKDITEDC